MTEVARTYPDRRSFETNHANAKTKESAARRIIWAAALGWASAHPPEDAAPDGAEKSFFG
jgi:hypothetical protein